MTITLVRGHDETWPAHRAIPRALADSALAVAMSVESVWADQSDSPLSQTGARLAESYQSKPAAGEYTCGVELKPDYASIFADSPAHFNAFDANEGPRVCEPDARRLFFATACQPERTALRRFTHPLISAFVRAAA